MVAGAPPHLGAGVYAGSVRSLPAASRELNALLKALLAVEPRRRPTAQGAMAHAWFAGFDWPAFGARRLPAPYALDDSAPAPAPAPATTARGGRRQAAVVPVAAPRRDPALVRSFPLAAAAPGDAAAAVRAHALAAPPA